MLPHEHDVDLEVGESELVQVLQRLLQSVLLESVNRLEVDHLWRFLVDVDRALHQRAWLAEGIDWMLNLWLFDGVVIIHLLVVSGGLLSGNRLLGNHLDGLLGRGRLDEVTLDVHVDDRLGRLDAEDVTTDLVSKLDPTRLKSEEGSIAAIVGWSLELDRNFERGAGSNLILKSHDLGVHVIARSLKELGARGPRSLAIVAHPPRLAEGFTADDLVLVREALPDEASRVAQVLWLLVNWRLPLPRVLVILSCSWLGLVMLSWHHLTLVLTDELLGGLR